MVDTDKVNEILNKHKGILLQDSTDYPLRPLHETAEILENIDNPDKINMNTNFASPGERHDILICDELNSLNISPHEDSKLSQSFKELSISMKGKGREDKVRIAEGMQSNRGGKEGLNFGGLVQRQPADGGKHE